MLLFWDATFWWPPFLSFYIFLVFQRFWVIHRYHEAQTYQWGNKFFRYDFFATMSGLFFWIILSVGMLKSHKMAAILFLMTFGGLCSHQFLSCGRQKFLHKNQWGINLIYHADSDILWVLAWDIQTWGGQWSRCIYYILCILGQHHFLICLLESVLLVGSGSVPLWWSPQSQISEPTKLVSDGSVKNLHQSH